jgi:putative oligomerization/nucleic acid binding protein
MPGLVRGVARTAVVAGTAAGVAGRVNRRQQNRWAAQDQQAYEHEQYQQQQYAQQQYAQQPPPQQVVYAAAPAPAAPAAPAVDMDAKLAQLKELAALKEAGALTEAEFAAQKAKILGT